MLRPALAAFAFAAAAAVAGASEAHDASGPNAGAHSHPAAQLQGYKPEDRYDHGRDRFKRHPHYRLGKRVVHSHAIKTPPSVGSSSLYRLPSASR